MLPKVARLNQKDFNEVFLYGRKTYTPYGCLYSIPIINQKAVQFGVVIPKKKVKQAVKRNKSRRLVYFLISEILTTVCPGRYIISLREYTQKKQIIQDTRRLLETIHDKTYSK